jgi:hypothetical protein
VIVAEPRDGLAVWRGLGAATYDREQLEAFGQAALDYQCGPRGDPADVRRSWETTVGF